MAHITGKNGQVVVGTTATGIKSWTCDYTQEMIDVTDFADAGVKAFILGQSDWKGGFEGYKDGIPLSLSTVPVALQLIENTTSTGAKWTGSAYITGIHANTAYDGIVTYGYDYVGTGALTLSTA